MKVSICIPTYKHPDFLKRCLDSVLQQDFTNYEIIITDDSPDDSISRLAETYNDERIHYYKNDRTLGSPRNWNKAISKAKGEYIKILHHDDWLAEPYSLRKYVELLNNNPDADIAFSASCDIDEKGEKKSHIANETSLKKIEKDPPAIYLGNAIGAPSVCIFRNNKGYEFDPNLVWLVDIEFYIRLITAKRIFSYNPEILVNIGISEFQITQQCLAELKLRISEKLYLYHKLGLDNKSSEYRRSLIRTLGRESILSTAGLKKILPDTQFSFNLYDSILALYFYGRKLIGKCFK